MNRKKVLLARAFDVALQNRLWLGAQKRFMRPFIRAVNYHSVAPAHAPAFESQLRFYQKHFAPVGYDDLLALVEGRWNNPKPGLLISFDDGLRDHAEVAAPLLEKYGYVGWFFVPVGFVDAQVPEQRAYAQAHQIQPAWEHDPDDPRTAMTWVQVRDLAERHVVGCHTFTHRRLSDELSDEEMRLEIPGAKRRFEEMLGRPLDVFCWVGGEEWAYSRRAADVIADSGFRISFMTNNYPIRPGADLLQLQRTNVESDWEAAVVRFQFSGFMDVLYTGKRRRVNRLTRRRSNGAASA